MVNIKKIRRIPVLMIISQLMLTGFVAYWLTSQYREEKGLMRDELSRIYDESRGQVIDSLLFNRVVEPALKDTMTITMMSAEKSDTMHRKTADQPMNKAWFRQEKTDGKNAFVTIAMEDTNMVKNIGHTGSITLVNKRQDLLLRSVKLFISHAGDSVTSTDAMPSFLPGKPDTALFKKFYNERLAEKKFGVHVVWVQDNVKNVQIVKRGENEKKLEAVKVGAMVGSGGMFFRNVFPDDLPGVQIKNDFPYLIRRISPQILFALILLLLTGSAFFFTNRSLKRQMMLNGLRNDFVSNITHELKTPVSTVKVAIEALKTFDKVNNPEVTRDYLDMAGQELNRLDQLISKVLDQSLIGEQKQVIQLQPSDLKILIDTVLLSLQPRLTAQHASAIFEPSPISGLIMIDPLHFQGLMCNLIDNSLKYGSDNPEIIIRLWEHGESAFIEVMDNGPGIPKEYLGRVFDKFFRVPTGDRHNIKGYGLGLSFASLVMKQHGGSISVKNLDRGGCSFTLRFPLITS